MAPDAEFPAAPPAGERPTNGQSTPRSHSRFGILAEAAEDAIFELDREGKYLFMNEAGARRLGIPSESMIGRSLRDFFPVDASVLLQTLDSVFSTGKTVSTLRKVTVKGKQLLFSAVLVPIKNHNGEVQSALVIARDISWIRRLAKRAKRNQRRVRDLFRNMGEGVGIVDPDENFLFVNPAAHAIFGVPPGRLKNRNMREFVTAEAWQLVLSQTSQRREGATSTYQLEVVRPDGERRCLHVTATARRSRSGEYLGAFGVFGDVTTQKRAEEALRRTSEELEELVARRTAQLSQVVEELQRQIQETNEAKAARKISESRFRAIFDSALDSVFIKDRSSRYLEVNASMERLFHKPAGELVGKTDMDLFSEEDGQRLKAEDQRVLQGEVLDLETTKSVGGIRRVFHTIKVPLRDNSGTIVGLCGIARDVTRRKTAEAELIESRERLRLLTAYADANREEENKRISREIHDELGQNLTVAKYELAGLRKALPADNPDLLGRLESLDSRLDSVTQDVRRIARNLRPPLLDHFGLEAAIECLANEFQERTGIQCELVSKASDVPMDDSAAISVFRMCQEALTNAARHSGASSVKLILSADDHQFRLEITDNGRGIKPEDLNKPTLGLLGMEERARRLGGQFHIGPAPGGGTRVTVSAPTTNLP